MYHVRILQNWNNSELIPDDWESTSFSYSDEEVVKDTNETDLSKKIYVVGNREITFDPEQYTDKDFFVSSPREASITFLKDSDGWLEEKFKSANTSLQNEREEINVVLYYDENGNKIEYENYYQGIDPQIIIGNFIVNNDGESIKVYGKDIILQQYSKYVIQIYSLFNNVEKVLYTGFVNKVETSTTKETITIRCIDVLGILSQMSENLIKIFGFYEDKPYYGVASVLFDNFLNKVIDLTNLELSIYNNISILHYIDSLDSVTVGQEYTTTLAQNAPSNNIDNFYNETSGGSLIEPNMNNMTLIDMQTKNISSNVFYSGKYGNFILYCLQVTKVIYEHINGYNVVDTFSAIYQMNIDNTGQTLGGFILDPDNFQFISSNIIDDLSEINFDDYLGTAIDDFFESNKLRGNFTLTQAEGWIIMDSTFNDKVVKIQAIYSDGSRFENIIPFVSDSITYKQILKCILYLNKIFMYCDGEGNIKFANKDNLEGTNTIYIDDRDILLDGYSESVIDRGIDEISDALDIIWSNPTSTELQDLNMQMRTEYSNIFMNKYHSQINLRILHKSRITGNYLSLELGNSIYVFNSFYTISKCKLNDTGFYYEVELLKIGDTYTNISEFQYSLPWSISVIDNHGVNPTLNGNINYINDENNATYWIGRINNSIITFSSPSNTKFYITKYKVMSPNPIYNITGWFLDGRNFGDIGWTYVDTQSGLSPMQTEVEFTLSTPRFFDEYRIRLMQSANSNSCSIHEFNMYGKILGN